MPDKALIRDIQIFLDSVGDGILVVNPKGIIVKSNKIACDILGYTGNSCQSKVEGMDCLSLLVATNEKGQVIDNKNAAFYKSLHQGVKVSNVKRQFIKKDGSRIWTAITTSPIKEKNKIKGVIIIIRDITQEIKQEEYQKDFAHTASHNLRSPLGNVLWSLEYILLEKFGKLTEKQKDYLTGAYNSLQNMNKLINDLLNLSRIQNDKIKANQNKTAGVEDVVDEILKDLCHFEKICHANIKFKDRSVKSHYVKANQEQLKYAIQNIIENALRYSAEADSVTLEVKDDNDYTTFSCSNTGIGIPKEEQKFIFAKFYRARNAMTQRSEGTGLGMYVSKELMRLNSAKIWFESTNGVTTFYIRLKKAHI